MRKLLLFSLILIVGIVFIGRLSYLQLYIAPKQDLYSDNAIRKVFDYPKRGYIYDRNGELLVSNQPSYDVMVIPREVKPLDTSEFCTLLKIDTSDFIKKFDKANHFSPRLPSVFLSHLSKEDYAFLQEKMRKYEGFYIQKRSLRKYNTTIGANVLGYIAEVNRSIMQKDPYYKMGDLIGKQGVELSYENILRGVKGIKFIQKDRFNRDIGPYKGGTYDTIPKPGKDVTTTIDSKLQEYGEKLMVNKRGGIIAIEPSSGEILAMITAPNYNPNLLVGRIRSKNYNKLHNDTINRPLFDRGLQAMYEPGSPFKTLNALIGLQEGVITTEEKVTCYHGYKYGNRFMGCHCNSGTKNNMVRGIQESCNAYFATVYRRVIEKYNSPAKGMDTWNKHISSFGLGNYLGYDLATGQPGKIPSSETYNNMYGENRWYATFTLSNAIGQGEVLATPIQLANMTAAIANRGYFYTPHIIKKIEDQDIDTKYTTPIKTTINPKHFEPVIQGMNMVYKNGTAKYIQIPGIEICGKTGTAENFTKINGARKQLTDHSIFIAFAPKDNPKIALAVYVENGYWGSRWAGRIAGLMIEKYINGEITRTDMEQFVLEGSLEEEYAKPYLGSSFYINDGSDFIEIIPKENDDQTNQ